MDDIEQKVNEFCQKIEDWISINKIDYGVTDSEEIENCNKILSMTEKDLRNLNSMDCQIYLFSLNKYLYYLNRILAREKSVKTYADQGIWYIVSGFSNEKMFKWEERYYNALRRSKIATELQKLKTASEVRSHHTEITIKTVEGAIKILENIGRSKSYDRS